MKTTPFLFISLLLITFSACKKQDVSNTVYKVKTITEGSTTVTYSYNDGVLTGSQSSAGPTTSVVYGNSTVTIYAPGADTTLYKLNSEGRAVESINSYGSTFYTYNSNGTINTITTPDDTTVHTWLDGNLISSVSSTGITTNYTYYTDKYSTLNNANLGMSFLDLGSKNLTKNVSITGGMMSFEYTYEFDNMDRAIKRTETLTPGGQTQVTSYTYLD